MIRHPSTIGYTIHTLDMKIISFFALNLHFKPWFLNFLAGLAPQNLTPTTLPSVTFFLQVCYMFSWLWGSDFGVPN